MQNLTAANIEIIIEEVTRANITFSHLREDLIDHMCCEIENEMQQGSSFDRAFEKVKNIFGNKELKKVQEDTLLLIDKKYRLMKKTMKIVGWISMLMITVGALFKIQHWPGAGPLLIFGFFFLGAIFFPSALWVMRKESKLKGSLFTYIISIIGGILFIFGILFKIQHYPFDKLFLIIGFSSLGLILIPSILILKLRDENTRNHKGTYIIGAISLIIYLAGMLFKIVHWPGALPCLIVGAIGLTTIFFPLFTMKVYKNAENIKASFLFLCTGILFFNMFSLLLAINVSKDVLSLFIKPGTEIIKTATILENKSNALSEKIMTDSLIQDTVKSKIKNIVTMSDEVINFIEDIKIGLITEVDGVRKDEARTAIKNPSLIINKSNYDIPTFLLCGNTQDGKSGKASEMKTKIKTLKNTLLNYCISDEDAVTIISKALEIKDSVFIKEEGKYFCWELINFYHLPLLPTIDKLCFFQRNVRFAELETLESLNSRYFVDNRNTVNKTK